MFVPLSLLGLHYESTSTQRPWMTALFIVVYLLFIIPTLGGVTVFLWMIQRGEKSAMSAASKVNRLNRLMTFTTVAFYAFFLIVLVGGIFVLIMGDGYITDWNYLLLHFCMKLVELVMIFCSLLLTSRYLACDPVYKVRALRILIEGHLAVSMGSDANDSVSTSIGPDSDEVSYVESSELYVYSFHSTSNSRAAFSDSRTFGGRTMETRIVTASESMSMGMSKSSKNKSKSENGKRESVSKGEKSEYEGESENESEPREVSQKRGKKTERMEKERKKRKSKSRKEGKSSCRSTVTSATD
eukprot:TRINITY_DN1011_c0_g1_i1.p1 TRINITY_DN1011_c0_g1~~TRINITY_DN1011_c0_g1_i1.p1  ORF type:complete len:299 (-),score=49.46 TRINITY_DN1011_c0_g1_i1:167-1063(-)